MAAMTLTALPAAPTPSRPPAPGWWGDGGPLRIAPWPDPVVERSGFTPRSAYVERCWLPVLGPSALLLVRRAGDLLMAHPEGCEIDTAATARALGLGGAGGRHAPFPRAIGRCVRFGVARPLGTTAGEGDGPPSPVLAFRRMLAPLPARRTAALGPGRWPEPGPPDDAATYRGQRRRAMAAAVEMAPAAPDPGALEGYLHAIGVHPALAHEAAACAAAWVGGGPGGSARP